MSLDGTRTDAYVVIMAGGSGERFWPLSRTTRPKQLLPLLEADVSMLEQAVRRIAPLVPRERILVVTSSVLQEPIRQAMPDLPPQNVIAEPAKRNTAPCLALAAVKIMEQGDRDPVMAVLTADHFIGNEEAFLLNVATAIDVARHQNALVTMGIVPTRPETGYGYIEVGDANVTEGSDARQVLSFREKPDAGTARDYVLSGRYLWNSGMFFWRVSVLQAALQQHEPEIGAWMTQPGDIATSFATSFATLPSISIDYAVMERATNVIVVPASFPWDDVGSWDALLRMRQTDSRGSVTQGECVAVETSESVVVNTRVDGHVVTTVGLVGHVVVVTDDATLVCPTTHAQDVKLVVAALREQGRDDVL